MDYIIIINCISEQIQKNQENKINTELQNIKDMVAQGLQISCNEQEDLDNFGRLMHIAWMAKRSLSSAISNPHLDEIYNTALQTGALGGKLLGAGGGVAGCAKAL